MTNLETIVHMAKNILDWYNEVSPTAENKKKIAYQLSHRAEPFYDMILPEALTRSPKVRDMQLSIMTARQCIHDLTPAGEVRAYITTSSIVDGLLEIIKLSEEPFEVVRLEDNPPADIYGSPDISKVVVFEDADTISEKYELAALARTGQPYNYVMFSTESDKGYGISGSPVISLYGNKGPAAPGFADFDGDVIKAYRLTLSSPIKRGPGKGRTRVVSRFVSVFN
ncbi:hypothetical protein CENTIMANUS_00184 [Klebsiella phage vB_KpM_Centimanus]